MMASYPIKRDRYKSARGGKSRLLDILCRRCESPVLVYQKDGPGGLLRLYIDRILSPRGLSGMRHLPLNDIPYLKCPRCGNLLGSPYVYAKEKRPAYRLHREAIISRNASSGSLPPR